MKKTIAVIGLVILAGVINHSVSASDATVASQSTSVSFTLDSATASGLMTYAVVPQGNIRVEGDTAVIRGMATIRVPLTSLVGAVSSSNVPPAGYVATNLVSATFKRDGTNGFTGTAVFTKAVNP